MAATLSASQVEQFEKQGFLVVEDLFDAAADLDPIIAEYDGVLDRLASELVARGEISSTYSDLPFGKRLINIFAEGGKDYTQHFDFCLPQKGVKNETPIWLGPAIFNIITNSRLLNAVESLIGPEIYSNPVQHVRLKTPDHLTPKDPKTGRPIVPNASWHQDNGVLTPDADETNMLTVWFPLSDATEQNGCLELVPGSHRDGVLQHCPRDGILQIPASEFDRDSALAVPVKRGGALFMHRRTCHAAKINYSDDIRWSLDLRYNPVGQPGGRSLLPGFIVRSRVDPDAELRSAESWAEMWHEARSALARRDDPTYNRWNVSDSACA